MQLYYNGEPIVLSSFGSSGDTPIGTIISYLGKSAPKGYLICDGSIYSIAEYQNLAYFIKQEFGSYGYFGGDGTQTFAVPDMRNLFLRGYHGNSDELSGDIGKIQPGTVHPNILTAVFNNVHSIGAFDDAGSIRSSNTDTATDPTTLVAHITTLTAQNRSSTYPKTYTSRPVNMAVLYCIKAEYDRLPYIFSESDIYGEEEVQIGVYGPQKKPVYRKMITGVRLPADGANSSSSYVDIADLDIDSLLFVSAIAKRDSSDVEGVLPIQTLTNAGIINRYGLYVSNSRITIQHSTNATSSTNTDSWLGAQARITLIYTKTTD